MTTVILIIHILIAVALIGTVLIQRSEGGALGMGGASGLVTSRAASSALTKTTGILAAAFMVTSIVLAILAGVGGRPSSILDQPAAQDAPAGDRPSEPSVPLSR
ncbi:MAG: preprotein translocase subunit SecG [Alphaproteobacteria bacterium]|nr:preprotein translocase subunit SecG [Alphaproteobacteria bacterium]